MNINLKQTNLVIKPTTKRGSGSNKPAIGIVGEAPSSGARTNKSKSQSPLAAFLNSGKTVKLEELYGFANQLSILLESGVPLVTCLSILIQQTENKYFHDILENISDDLNGGYTFTKAISKFPKVFPTLFISMVRAAEHGGNMGEVLRQLSTYLEHQHKMQKKLKSALVYPKFVSGFFFLVLCAVMFGLVPKFESIFASFNTQLPTPTLILLAISNFVKKHLIVEIVITISGFFLFKQFKKTKNGRYIWDKLLLQLPVFGEVIAKAALSKFCRTLSILLKSGVSIVDAIEIAGSTAENVHFTAAFKQVRTGVIGGEAVNATLAQDPIFPPLVVSMIATGEHAGALDKMLISISELYDAHVDSKISGLISIVEPALMVGLGAVALVVIIALYLPIFQMSSIM